MMVWIAAVSLVVGICIGAVLMAITCGNALSEMHRELQEADDAPYTRRMPQRGVRE